jgi:beta-lactamase regulating signal transducer with metallopeptidase domain
MDVILNWLWQGLAVALATAGVLHVIDPSRSQTRYWIVWTALLVVLVLPALSVLPAVSTAASGVRVSAIALGAPDPVVRIPPSRWTSTTIVVLLLTTWTGAYTWRVVLALVALQRARRQSLPFPQAVEARLRCWNRAREIGRRANLVVSDRVRSAAVFGGSSPAIALSPTLLESLADEELDRVVIHEWVHVQRHDDIAYGLQVVIRIVAGWHPAVRWLDRQLHFERESACDEAAVAATGSPKAYAACLARLASLPSARLRPLPVVAALSASSVHRRVVRVLSRRPDVPNRPLWVAVSMAAALLLVLGVAVGRLHLVKVVTGGGTAATPPMSVVSFTGSARADADGVPAARSLERAAGEAASYRSSAVGPRADQEATVWSDVTRRDGPVAEPPAVFLESRRVPVDAISPTIPGLASVKVAGAIAASVAPEREPIENHAQASLVTEPVGGRPAPSPWQAAAVAGVAIGRESRDAGLATAGFFTRVGRTIAGSF